MQIFEGWQCSLQQLLSLDVEQISEHFSSFTTIDTQRHNDLMLYLETANKARNYIEFTFLYHYTQYAEAVAHLRTYILYGV